MKCEFCDGTTMPKKVTKSHWRKGRLYIVEDVDAEVCTDCGERYFHAGVLDGIDVIIDGKHGVKKILEVEVLTAKAPKLGGYAVPRPRKSVVAEKRKAYRS
jgi:YgiT-type zinc finger domain-containing protein